MNKSYRYQILDKESSTASYLYVEARDAGEAAKKLCEQQKTKIYAMRKNFCNWQKLENGVWVWVV